MYSLYSFYYYYYFIIFLQIILYSSKVRCILCLTMQTMHYYAKAVFLCKDFNYKVAKKQQDVTVDKKVALTQKSRYNTNMH